MKKHYYLGWFNNFFPNTLANALQKDIINRNSIAMISSNPFDYEEKGATELSWLSQAGIFFEEYHLINHQVPKKDAQKLIQQASVIFLLGGSIINLNRFLREYELMALIKNSNAVILGASVGAINMSKKFLCSKSFGDDIETKAIYEGIGLDDFSVLSHFDLENNMALVQKELSPLSNELPIYASNKDCAVRVIANNIDIFGHVYLVANGNIQNLKETL